MFFRIISNTPSADLAKYRAKRHAKLALATHKISITELKLDNYLKTNYNLTLIQACKQIIQEAKFSMNMRKEIIVTIPDENLNTIARIITYGTGKVQGSTILRDIWRL